MIALGTKPLFEQSRFTNPKGLLLKLLKYAHFDLALELDFDEQIKNFSQTDRFSIFLLACQYGRLDMLDLFSDINLRVCHDAAFRTACQYGHLPVCQYLYEIGLVNIHAKQDASGESPFITACMNGHLTIAKSSNINILKIGFMT
jgi:ankyrin repeat protein